MPCSTTHCPRWLCPGLSRSMESRWPVSCSSAEPGLGSSGLEALCSGRLGPCASLAPRVTSPSTAVLPPLFHLLCLQLRAAETLMVGGCFSPGSADPMGSAENKGHRPLHIQESHLQWWAFQGRSVDKLLHERPVSRASALSCWCWAVQVPESCHCHPCRWRVRVGTGPGGEGRGSVAILVSTTPYPDPRSSTMPGRAQRVCVGGGVACMTNTCCFEWNLFHNWKSK